jgi:hypothetical protein
MKRLLLLLVVLVSVGASIGAVAPVMAEPAPQAPQEPFTATVVFTPGNVVPFGVVPDPVPAFLAPEDFKAWVAGDILQIKGAVSVGTITGDIEGTIWFVTGKTVNLKTSHGRCHSRVVITEDTAGQVPIFEGSHHGTHDMTEDPTVDVQTGRMVLHGTGDEYGGQKIMVSYEGEDEAGPGEETTFILDGMLLSP